MKNSKASILPKIIFAPAAVAAAVLVLGVQIFLARGAGGDGTFFSLLVGGGIVNIVILVSACLALCLVIRDIVRRLRSLENLLKPLSEKDYTALMALSGSPASGIPASKTDAAMAPLLESLAALGKFLAALDLRSAKNRELKDVLDGEAVEQDMALRQMEETIETITKQFDTIETWSKEGLKALEDLETGLKTLNGMTEDRPVPPGPPNESANPEGLSRPAELSGSVAERLRESADRAEKVKEAVDTGEDQARNAADLVKTINEKMDDITGMIKVINQISEQTNILSMNAAIESAHAGQAGAGFAVVAGEIRKLADSTRENAGRIYGELKEITGKSGEALKVSENSFQTINGVSGETGRLAKDLAEILAAAAETGALNGEPENSSGDDAAMPEGMKENISGMAARCQAFRTMLEQIEDLSGKTRTGVREIHSGAGEILGNIHAIRLQFLRHLEETGDTEKFLFSTATATPAASAVPVVSDSRKVATSAVPAAVAAPVAPAVPAVSGNREVAAPATSAVPAVSGNREVAASAAAAAPASVVSDSRKVAVPVVSDSREVAVKEPPWIIS